MMSESHEQGPGAADSLSGEQQKALCDGEVETHLVSAVERWCEWGEGEREGEREKVVFFLCLTAELCSVTRQVSLL